MRLCMFHPNDNPLDRGWVGRIEDDRMLHLAAQTLQSFFLVGGGSRVHAEYPLADVTLLVPVQYPPTVRLFDDGGAFRFANATAVVGPNVPVSGTRLSARARIAVVIGADGEIGGTTAMVEWHDPAEEPRREAVRLRDRARACGRDARRDGRGLVRLPAERGRAGRRGRTGGVLLGRGAGARRAPDDAPSRRRDRRAPGRRPRRASASDVLLEVDGIGTLACPLR